MRYSHYATSSLGKNNTIKIVPFLPQEYIIIFKTKCDTAHARPITGSPHDWLIFGPTTGQNMVPGQSHRFGHGDVSIINSKCDNETHRCTSQKCIGFLVIIL